MRFIPAIIIATALLLAPVLFYTIPILFFEEETFDGPAVDSAARIDIEILRQQIESLQARIDALESRPVGPGTGGFTSPSGEVLPQGPNTIADIYPQVVLIADRRNVNRGLSVASPSFLAEMLGPPRPDLSDNCQDMTNQRLKDMLVVQQVGPVRVRLLRPAAESLARVFEKVRETDQDLYDRINTAGSLCVRRIRGSVNSISSHAFGLSLDLNIDGQLDTLGDGKTQMGLTILADFFKAEGWIWGAGFSREDSMHFEVSRELVERWRAEGLI